MYAIYSVPSLRADCFLSKKQGNKCMKFFKSSMVWALVILVGVAHNASAGRFIVWGNTVQKFIDASTKYPDRYPRGTLGVGKSGSFAIVQIDEDAGRDEYGRPQRYEWISLDNEHPQLPIVLQVDGIDSVEALKTYAKQEEFTSWYKVLESWQTVFERDMGVAIKTPTEALAAQQEAARAKKEASAAGEDHTEDSSGSDDESDDDESGSDDEGNATPKGSKGNKPDSASVDDKDKKPDAQPKGLKKRFASLFPSHRYGASTVAILVVASILQVMQDGYRGVGIEAKDVTALSVKKKALRALAACVSLKRYGANVSALYRVVRPVSEKGVMSPKFLARATQFAKNKPFIAAGLLGVTALNVYGAYSHAGDIKAYAKSFRKTKTA